jgi:hypothetical protein
MKAIYTGRGGGGENSIHMYIGEEKNSRETREAINSPPTMRFMHPCPV